MNAEMENAGFLILPKYNILKISMLFSLVVQVFQDL
jgi:hypothetical protein